MKQSNRRAGIKWKIFGYFVFFVAVVLALIWLFQSLLLDDFYEWIKRRELTTTADAIADAITDPVQEAALDETVAYYAVNHSLCAMIYRVENNFARIVANADVITGCVLHSISDRERSQLYEAAVQAGGAYTEVISLNSPSPYGTSARENVAAGTIYVRLAESSAGTPYIIMLNAALAPVSATVHTLRVQLIVLSGILLIVALLLAFAISRKISAPIVRIGDAAKRFAGDSMTLILPAVATVRWTIWRIR